jgi:hypothetical protein
VVVVPYASAGTTHEVRAEPVRRLAVNSKEVVDGFMMAIARADKSA